MSHYYSDTTNFFPGWTQQIVSHNVDEEVKKAAKAIKEADAVVFTSGAGMGVDSGIPDFRGADGFWKAYPPMKHLSIEFSMMSSPQWFDRDPHFAWGFWSHRFKLYNSATPHAGFDVLKHIAASKEKTGGYFIYTSNCDGQYQKAGFPDDKILECHGTVHWMQCSKGCADEIWSNVGLEVKFDEETFRATDLPECRRCKAVARPNVLMFGDWNWVSARTNTQERRFEEFILNVKRNKKKVVVLEVGAGLVVPTIRLKGESLVRDLGGTIIRVNVTDTGSPRGSVVVPLGGKEALMRIEEAMNEIL